jgi:hypothetical protein
MAFVFVFTTPVLIVRALPITFQLGTGNLYPFWLFLIRSLTTGLFLFTPPFVILACIHNRWDEAIPGIILAILGTLNACLFWFSGVWKNKSLINQ